MIANIRSLVEKARASQVPVVWGSTRTKSGQGDGDDGAPSWRIGEPLVHKHYGDSFEDTDLESVLAERGVAGYRPAPRRTNASGRRCTARSSVGMMTTLVGDATPPRDLSECAPPPDKVVDHTNLYWRYHSGPGRTAGVVKTAEVEF